VLLICAAARNDQTCPGEMSKTYRLCSTARGVLSSVSDFAVDFLDLSRLTAEYGRVIYPCKACVSTAMPLCHWPCSCYPNHSLGQVQDWRALSALGRRARSHDGAARLAVSATSEGPCVLGSRARRCARHADIAPLARRLAIGHAARLGRTECELRPLHRYYEPYATSHDALDEDAAIHEEVRNAARALLGKVRELRGGERFDEGTLEDPRPK
jgi:hypothetical protein